MTPVRYMDTNDMDTIFDEKRIDRYPTQGTYSKIAVMS